MRGLAGGGVGLVVVLVVFVVLLVCDGGGVWLSRVDCRLEVGIGVGVVDFGGLGSRSCGWIGVGGWGVSC